MRPLLLFTLSAALHAAQKKIPSPDGTGRVGIRGCESSGWIDSTRVYCEGTFNPSMVIYRWFDAMSGKEIGESFGSEFTWSPDRTTLANRAL